MNKKKRLMGPQREREREREYLLGFTTLEHREITTNIAE